MKSARRLALRYLKWPLYIPRERFAAVKFLGPDGPGPFIDELDRLARLGSPWASAARAFLCLQLGDGGRRDAARALQWCQPYADRGDPYAQFVYMMGLVLTGALDVDVDRADLVWLLYVQSLAYLLAAEFLLNVV
jgi:hypothetical protein